MRGFVDTCPVEGIDVICCWPDVDLLFTKDMMGCLYLSLTRGGKGLAFQLLNPSKQELEGPSGAEVGSAMFPTIANARAG